MSVIININHDSSTNLTDATNYTSAATGGGDLTIATGAALAGSTNGMNFVINDTTTLYGLKTLGAGDTSGIVRWRVYIDPNSMTMANADTFTFNELYAGASTAIARFAIGFTTVGGYHINAGIVNDAGSYTNTSDYTITDAQHYIECHLIRATSNVASDGSLQLWIDGVSKGTVTGIDNYDRFSYFQRFYMCAYQVDAGTTGTLFLDELIVNNDGGAIGPVITSTINLLSGKLDRRGKL